MNRIILVGNGFDLAHNLRTSYKDFIEWYWDEWLYKLRKSHYKTETDELCSFTLKNDRDVWSGFLWNYISPIAKYKGKEVIDEMLEHEEIFTIKICPFLENICNSIEEKNWVDIESEYYQCLLNTEQYPVKELNRQLEFIKTKLIEYLHTIPQPPKEDTIEALFKAPIHKKDISISALQHWYDFVSARCNYNEGEWAALFANYEFDCKQKPFAIYGDMPERYGLQRQPHYTASEIERMFDLEYLPEALTPNKTLLLNFNYTTIADRYIPHTEAFSIIHIHGELSTPNSVIFGYGDDTDENYSTLEKKNDNEYLKHMKTAHYWEDENYRKMRSFMELAPYQVCILGHSCGISDRTLLNELFEHDNCVSIKPYYHVKGENKDDYLDKVNDISRNFTNAKKKRERVVNKRYCEPLPQLKAE